MLSLQEMEKLFCRLLSLILLTQLALCTPAPESTVTPKGSTTEGPTSLTETVQLSNKIISLEEQFVILQNSLKDIKNEMRNSYHQLKEQVQGDVRELLTDIGALRVKQQELSQSITESVDGVNKTIQTLSTDNANAVTQAQLSTLQTRLDTLTSQITSPVNLYQSCVEVKRTCTITGGLGTSSYRECTTSSMPIEVSHFSMQCMSHKTLRSSGHSSIAFHIRVFLDLSQPREYLTGHFPL